MVAHSLDCDHLVFTPTFSHLDHQAKLISPLFNEMTHQDKSITMVNHIPLNPVAIVHHLISNELL